MAKIVQAQEKLEEDFKIHGKEFLQNIVDNKENEYFKGYDKKIVGNIVLYLELLLNKGGETDYGESRRQYETKLGDQELSILTNIMGGLQQKLGMNDNDFCAGMKHYMSPPLVDKIMKQETRQPAMRERSKLIVGPRRSLGNKESDLTRQAKDYLLNVVKDEGTRSELEKSYNKLEVIYALEYVGLFLRKNDLKNQEMDKTQLKPNHIAILADVMSGLERKLKIQDNEELRGVLKRFMPEKVVDDIINKKSLNELEKAASAVTNLGSSTSGREPAPLPPQKPQISL